MQTSILKIVYTTTSPSRLWHYSLQYMTSCFVQQSVGQNGKVSHLLASMLARQAIHQNIVDMLGSISSLVCSAASCRACSAQLASPTTAMRLLALRSARGRHLASFRSASKSFTGHSPTPLFLPFPVFVRSLEYSTRRTRSHCLMFYQQSATVRRSNLCGTPVSK